MNYFTFFCVIFYCACICVPVSKCQNSTTAVPNLPRKEILDTKGKFWLEWTVNWTDHTITFDIVAETVGWVGFGLSNNGKMSGADLIIGGMKANGLPYFSDRHAVSNQVPVEDPEQNWELLECTESSTHTFISVRRKLDTCDPHDYPITENRVSIIWAYGKNDKNIRYHEGNRGSYDVYLLDPNYAPYIVRDRHTVDPEILDRTGINTPEDGQVWTIPRNVTIPERETSYLCSIHKAPQLKTKHHVIGLDVWFYNELSRNHTHHLDIYKCNLPRAGQPPNTTAASLFGPFLNQEPETCYNLLTPKSNGIPTQYCTEYYFGWAVGGRSFFNAPHVGFPLGVEEDEYYLVQVHYDNPQKEKNIEVNLRLDLFYTAQLRPNEGGLLLITHEIPGNPESFLVPHKSLDHRIYGHCSPECTRRIFGPGGKIEVYGALLHSHNAGRKLRLHHFRGGKELPWVVFDDNWSSQFQHFRNLREEREIRAGDQLTVDCSYATNETSVVGGYATKQEMCLAYVVYYNRIRDYNVCASQLVNLENRGKFLAGTANVTWEQNKVEWVVQTPEELRGYTGSEVADNLVKWDENLKKELQREQTVGAHQGTCYREPFSRQIAIAPHSMGLSEDDFRGPVHYPLEAEAYFGPTRNCSKNNNETAKT